MSIWDLAERGRITAAKLCSDKEMDAFVVASCEKERE